MRGKTFVPEASINLSCFLLECSVCLSRDSTKKASNQSEIAAITVWPAGKAPFDDNTRIFHVFERRIGMNEYVHRFFCLQLLADEANGSIPYTRARKPYVSKPQK